jgi:hypothetical protein
MKTDAWPQATARCARNQPKDAAAIGSAGAFITQPQFPVQIAQQRTPSKDFCVRVPDEPRRPTPAAARRVRLRRHEFGANAEGNYGQLGLCQSCRFWLIVTLHKTRDNRLLCALGIKLGTVLSVCCEYNSCDPVSEWTSGPIPPILLCQPQRTSAAGLVRRGPTHPSLTRRYPNNLTDAANNLRW